MELIRCLSIIPLMEMIQYFLSDRALGVALPL